MAKRYRNLELSRRWAAALALLVVVAPSGAATPAAAAPGAGGGGRKSPMIPMLGAEAPGGGIC